MHILLVEPNYYTKFPPLGLLKVSSYHKLLGDSVELIRDFSFPKKKPDRIYITSLFTYSWRPIHDVISRYKMVYPKVDIILGGIYASLLPDHAELSRADHIYRGLFNEAEELLPDYSLIPKWMGSLVHSSRGCVHNCPFCAVSELEPRFIARKSIKKFVYPKHKRITFFDNNFLASPYLYDIIGELYELDLEVDFNQGLDARLINSEIAEALKPLKMKYIRLAYDNIKDRNVVEKAIKTLNDAGFHRSQIIIYTLFNFDDSPDSFLDRLRDIMEWKVTSYPMRYEPIDSLEKGRYVAPDWTPELLEMIAKARRVMGYRGAFPPYLKRKFLEANNFVDAFILRPPKKYNRNIALFDIEKFEDLC